MDYVIWKQHETGYQTISKAKTRRTNNGQIYVVCDGYVTNGKWSCSIPISVTYSCLAHAPPPRSRRIILLIHCALCDVRVLPRASTFIVFFHSCSFSYRQTLALSISIHFFIFDQCIVLPFPYTDHSRSTPTRRFSLVYSPFSSESIQSELPSVTTSNVLMLKFINQTCEFYLQSLDATLHKHLP